MKTKIINLLFFVLLLASCKKQTVNFEGGSVAEMEKVYNEETPPPALMSQNQYNPKLIKKGDVTVSSLDIEATKSLIYGFVKTCNGYVANERLFSNDPNNYYQISFNIQASYFDRFIFLLDSSKLNVTSRSFSVDDVTMRYIDDSTRLENKRKLETRYLELLSKTKDIKDILAIEEKLEDIRTEIDVKGNQLKVLEKQIAYSGFDMTINKTNNLLTINDTDKYSYKLGQGINNGWEGIKMFFIFLLSIWPIYIIVALIYFLIKGLIKRKKIKN